LPERASCEARPSRRRQSPRVCITSSDSRRGKRSSVRCSRRRTTSGWRKRAWSNRLSPRRKPTFHQEGPVADLHVMTATGTQTVVDETRLQTLKSTLRGELLRPGDAGYDEARTVFNAMIDRRPGLIARCGGAADVVECVRFARMHALLLSVRGTGHNVGGLSVCDGGFMIDLSHMKGIRVDPAARSARVEGGVTWGELNDELQAFGLAATGGFVSTTGVSGLTLGGGLGWLVRKHGLALDNLLSVEIVTADGELRTASLDSHPDLFWALRGGGGNFGVVTSFEFRVHAAGTVLAGLVIHPLAKAAEALQFWREFESSAPDEVTNG